MRKLPLLFMFLGIAILTSAVLISSSMINALIGMNGFYGMSKVSITAKNKAADKLFSLRDISNLKKELETDEIAYCAMADASIKKGSRVFYAKVIGANPYYRNFTDIGMIYGSFFSYEEEEIKYVAVVDANLAWKMFSSIDIVGQEIKLYNRTFEVVGVYEKYKLIDDGSNENVIEKLSNDGLNRVFIPMNTLMELDKSILTDTVFIKTDPEILIGENKKLVENALQSTGKWAPDYVITDYIEKMALLEQKPKIVLFAIGTITVFFILSYVKETFSNTLHSIRKQIAGSYLSEVIFRNRHCLAMCLIKAVTGILLSAVLIFIVKFDLYIPPEYLSDDLIDTEYYDDLLDTKIHEHNQNLSVYKSQVQLEHDIASKLISIQCLLAMLIGIPLIHMGIDRLLQVKMQVTKAVIICACLFGISAIAALLLSTMMRLPCEIDQKSICVIWTYVFADVAYAFHRKENRAKSSTERSSMEEGSYVL